MIVELQSNLWFDFRFLWLGGGRKRVDAAEISRKQSLFQQQKKHLDPICLTLIEILPLEKP